MNKQIQRVQSEKLNFPIGGTTSIIKKLSSNSVGIFKSHFEQFITTQPGMIDLVNNICQELTYNDLKSVKYVSKEFQVWISNSELFRLAYEADAIIDKVIASIKDGSFREHFGKVLTNVYKRVIGNFNANMLKILIKLMKNYLEDVVKMASSVVVETDEILFSYQNYMMDICVSFQILALLCRFWCSNMGVKNAQEMAPLQTFQSMFGK
jgi:23S rRNA maturation mini-RNase III